MIELVIEARPRDVGGFVVGRVLPAIQRRTVGPFTFLDHMGPADTAITVRPHPHIHLATVTYLFDGDIVHRDSLGSRQVIQPGAINWMHAGRGIVHSERSEVPERMHGLQLWVGLPRAHEDTDPTFVHTPVSALPIVDGDGAHVRVLAGTAYGRTSPVTSASPLFYVDVQLAAGARIELPTDYPERAVYVIDGKLTAGDRTIDPRQMAVFASGDAPALVAEQPTRFVILGGEPLDGPRHLWWNFVSSDKDAIVEAARAWRAGEFPKVPGDEVEFIPAPDGDPRIAR